MIKPIVNLIIILIAAFPLTLRAVSLQNVCINKTLGNDDNCWFVKYRFDFRSHEHEIDITGMKAQLSSDESKNLNEILSKQVEISKISKNCFELLVPLESFDRKGKESCLLQDTSFIESIGKVWDDSCPDSLFLEPLGEGQYRLNVQVFYCDLSESKYPGFLKFSDEVSLKRE